VSAAVEPSAEARAGHGASAGSRVKAVPHSGLTARKRRWSRVSRRVVRGRVVLLVGVDEGEEAAGVPDDHYRASFHARATAERVVLCLPTWA
jgi:hypothetical protein